MADIDQIIAGGAGASSRADFSGFNGILDSFYKGRDEKAKTDLRDAFQGGVPTLQDGSPDFSAMAKTLFQKGGLDQGVSASNLGLQQQNLQQNREGANFAATGRDGQSDIVSPPSANRSATATVAPALNKGGNGPPQGGITPAAFLQKNGIQSGYNMEVALAAFKRLPNGGIAPDQQFNPDDPAIAAKIAPVLQRLKGVGQVQPGQPGDNTPQGAPAPQQSGQQPQPQMAQAPQQAPQQATQAQPSPFANAVAAGLIPPGVDPNRYVAGLKYRAAALPKGPAQEMMQSQVNAIDKATELTATQRDYNAAQANPKIDERAAQMKADEARATGVATADVKEQGDYVTQGKKASDRLITLNSIGNIINNDPNLTLGFGADTALKVKMALKQIGVDTGDLSGAQAIQKLNSVLAAESTKSISPRPAQFEFKTFLGNNPGLSLDKAGNQRVIGIYSELAKRDVDLGRLARQNRDNWENWDSVVQQYDKQNPIKDPTTGKVITTDSVIAPSPTKTKSSAPSLEPGKTVVNGHTYKGGNPNNKANWELRS